MTRIFLENGICDTELWFHCKGNKMVYSVIDDIACDYWNSWQLKDLIQCANAKEI